MIVNNKFKVNTDKCQDTYADVWYFHNKRSSKDFKLPTKCLQKKTYMNEDCDDSKRKQ